MARGKHWRRRLVIGAAAALAVFLGLCVAGMAAPSGGARRPKPRTWIIDHRSPVEDIAARSLEVLAGMWFFAFGATIGSFLNVVAYRTPRGLSVVWSSSRCPRCEARIRPRDNVPVLSWLLLRGRCRTCGAPISPRYPAVEFISGSIFLSLACLELFAGGANLPTPAPEHFRGVFQTLLDGNWDLARIYAFHCLLLSVLLSGALIKLDGHALPKRTFAGGIGIGMAALVLWPAALHPVAWVVPAPVCLRGLPQLAGVAGGLVGLSAGAGLGAAVGAGLSLRGRGGPPVRDHQPQTSLGLGLAGLYLGWQAAISVAVLAAAVRLVSAAFARSVTRFSAPPMLAHVLLASFAHICLWKVLCRLHWWPGPDSPVAAVSVACIVVLGASLGAGWIDPVDSRRLAEPGGAAR